MPCSCAKQTEEEFSTLTSGAIQYGVPTIVFLFSSPWTLAQNPKSVTLTVPSIPSKTLSDFISRWIIPCKINNSIAIKLKYAGIIYT